MAKIRGVVCVVSTPMDRNHQIDEEAIYKTADFLIDKGIGGFWLLGSQGEDINITLEQRFQVAKSMAAAVDGRIPVLVGTGLTNVNEILDFNDQISGLKIAGIHYMYRDWKQEDARFISEVTRLADNSEYPIWLYNNIKRGKEISENAIKALKDHPNIHGVKYGSFYHMPFIKAAAQQTDEFQVMCAGNFFYTALCYGALASTNSSACWCPEEYVKLFDLYMAGRHAEAREQQFRLLALSASIPRTGNGENSTETKYGMSLRGLCQEYVNPAYRLFTDEEKKKFRQALRNYGFDWAPEN